ncbi:MAG: hypothetical protein LW923_04885 [Betaproteobacteria bacterium]|nr:hypothetical protein [Betaproteobacteria bacterium]
MQAAIADRVVPACRPGAGAIDEPGVPVEGCLGKSVRGRVYSAGGSSPRSAIVIGSIAVHADRSECVDDDVATQSPDEFQFVRSVDPESFDQERRL